MICIISGTNRADSNTRKISGIIHDILICQGQATTLLDLTKLPTSLLSPQAYENKPEEFARFRSAVLESQGLIIVTPEYNGGFPGVLKLFIDMLPFPESFEKRPVCFVGLSAGQWGALRPVEQLQQIFGYRNAHIFPERVFIPSIHQALNDSSLSDAKLQERLEQQLKGFVAFVRALQKQVG